MKKLLLLIVPVLTLSGCITPKSYVDPSYAKASYQDVKSVTNKYQSSVVVEFQRNGDKIKRVNKEVRNHVERVLRASGIMEPVTENADYTLKVVVNNLADISDAAAKGFGTGLTFGAVGTLVTDYYEVTITYTDKKGTEQSKKYKHALHTTIGNKEAPFENVEPTTPADAFGTVVEQVLLNFITEMQSQGLLTFVSYKQATA